MAVVRGIIDGSNDLGVDYCADTISGNGDGVVNECVCVCVCVVCSQLGISESKPQKRDFAEIRGLIISL